MEAPCIIPDAFLKSIEINKDGKKYICQIEIIDELIQTNIFLDNKLNYKGNIFLEKIQFQIKAFFDYSIYEIFEEIRQLKPDNFSLIKEYNKYKLKIEFIILRKKRNIIIDLKKNKKEEEIKYENIIKEKDNIIYELKEKIKELEKKLNQKGNEYDSNNNNNLYDNFNINLKNPIHKLNFHINSVNCLAVLNDGRLVSGSDDKNIIIYNKMTYKPDVIIKEHKSHVHYITQLSEGILASCSYDKTIKLFIIKGNKYKTLQTLNYHSNSIYKVLELKNKYLVSCSEDKSIIFYFKDNSKYKLDYKKIINGSCRTITQTKENEISYLENFNNNYNIYFFDLNERKIKSSISNINSTGSLGSFNMITKDLLVIGGKNNISIININEYKLIRIIEVTNSSIYGFCMLNENIFLTGDNNGKIRQYKVNGDNLTLISTKENTHGDNINALIKIGNGHVATCSSDKSIKIW